jgi:tripartite ATP-independent transporter DctP family solute receptor
MFGARRFGIFILALCLCMLVAIPGWAKAKYTMKIGTVWSADLTATNKCVNYLKPRIEELTGGQVQVELRKGNLGGERDMYEGVQLGTVEAAICTTGSLGGFIPLAEIFMVPYLFTNWNHCYAVLNGPFGERLNQLALEKGMRVMSWWSVGSREIYGNGEPIPNKPDLLKGKKIRVMETPFLVKLYKHYGAIPVPMSFTEVYTALQQGVVDGVQAGFSTTAAGHHEVAKWIVQVSENMTPMAFVVSERWWKKLPDDVKGAIKQATVEVTTIQHILDAQTELENKELWGKNAKLVMADREAFVKKARELYPEFEKLLGAEGAKWLNWIKTVGDAYPILEKTMLKDYAKDYKLDFTY